MGQRIRAWIIGVVIALGAVAMVVPIVILFVSSFKTKADVFAIAVTPDSFTLGSLVEAFTPELLHALLNSLLVSTVVTVVATRQH